MRPEATAQWTLCYPRAFKPWVLHGTCSQKAAGWAAPGAISFLSIHVLWRGIKILQKGSLTNCCQPPQKWCAHKWGTMQMPKPRSLQVRCIFRNSVLNHKIKKNPNTAGLLAARSGFVGWGQQGFDPVEWHSYLLLPLCKDYICWRAGEPLRLPVSVGTPEGKIRVSSELTGKFKTSSKKKSSKAEEIQGKKWNYS